MASLFALLKNRNRKAAPEAAPPAADPVEPLETALLHRRERQRENAPERPDMLRISCPDPSAEDAVRDGFLAQGQKLARQEDWQTLCARIAKADAQREMTPGAMPVADLLAYGARSDVVTAAEHALFDGHPPRDAPLMEGIEALEHELADSGNNPMLAAIVAQTHMDIGWAWRGTAWETEVPARNRAAFAAHFDRAADILDEVNAADSGSPILAAARCALLANGEPDEHRVADRYETLIDLNPANPRTMRAMGTHLLPRWFGSYAELELEARRTAARTELHWGAGAYTWVYFDALACDDQACANVDLPFFIEGLRDILRRRPDAYTANLLAAYCANALGSAVSGNDQADQNRVQIAECARWIVRDHLTELHAMIWAHAARGFDNNLRVRSPARFAASGREDAIRIISSLFSRELAAGQRITFVDTAPTAAQPA